MPPAPPVPPPGLNPAYQGMPGYTVTYNCMLTLPASLGHLLQVICCHSLRWLPPPPPPPPRCPHYGTVLTTTPTLQWIVTFLQMEVKGQCYLFMDRYGVCGIHSEVKFVVHKEMAKFGVRSARTSNKPSQISIQPERSVMM